MANMHREMASRNQFGQQQSHHYYHDGGMGEARSLSNQQQGRTQSCLPMPSFDPTVPPPRFSSTLFAPPSSQSVPRGTYSGYPGMHVAPSRVPLTKQDTVGAKDGLYQNMANNTPVIYGYTTQYHSGNNTAFQPRNKAPFQPRNNVPFQARNVPFQSRNIAPFSYQPLGIPSSSCGPPPQTTSQEECDRLWLKQWLEQRQIKQSIDVPTKTIKIGEACKLFQKCLSLNEQLKNARDELIKNIDSPNHEWNNSMTKTNQIKKELQSAQEILSDPVVINNLQGKIQKRKKKRLWFKNRMKRRYLENLEEEKRRERLHKKIDEWQKEKLEKDLAARKEASLKHEAGGVLGEVRRKLQDGRKLLELLKSIKKLREIRKSEGEKKGVYPKTSSEDDRHFTAKAVFIQKLVSKRIESYEDEEKALRVMIVEEEEEREKKQEQEREEQKALLNLSKESDPLAEFRRYYGQSEECIEYLVQIRREWDAYLAPDHVFGASRIPDGDISPALPSSDLWSAVLQDSDTVAG